MDLEGGVDITMINDYLMFRTFYVMGTNEQTLIGMRGRPVIAYHQVILMVSDYRTPATPEASQVCRLARRRCFRQNFCEAVQSPRSSRPWHAEAYLSHGKNSHPSVHVLMSAH